MLNISPGKMPLPDPTTKTLTTTLFEDAPKTPKTPSTSLDRDASTSSLSQRADVQRSPSSRNQDASVRPRLLRHDANPLSQTPSNASQQDASLPDLISPTAATEVPTVDAPRTPPSSSLELDASTRTRFSQPTLSPTGTIDNLVITSSDHSFDQASMSSTRYPPTAAASVGTSPFGTPNPVLVTLSPESDIQLEPAPFSSPPLSSTNFTAVDLIEVLLCHINPADEDLATFPLMFQSAEISKLLLDRMKTDDTGAFADRRWVSFMESQFQLAGIRLAMDPSDTDVAVRFYPLFEVLAPFLWLKEPPVHPPPPKTNVLALAIRRHLPSLVQFLLNYPAPITSKELNSVYNMKGWVPLATAAVFGDVKIVKMLLEAKAEVDGGYNIQSNFKTALFRACALDKVELVRLLLVNKADPNKCTSNGVTSLVNHVRSGRTKISIVKLLLEHNADPDAQLRDSGHSVHDYLKAHPLQQEILALLTPQPQESNSNQDFVMHV